MNFGCNTLYLNGRWNGNTCRFDRKHTVMSLDCIKNTGYDACEFSFFMHLSPEDELALNEYCRKIGLIPWSAHAWAEVADTPEGLALDTPNIIASLDDAKRLGCHILVVHASSQSPAPLERKHLLCFSEVLRRLSCEAAFRNITVAIENTQSLDVFKWLADIVFKLDLPAIGFNIDTGHATIQGGKPEDFIRVMGPKLFTTHLQDNYGLKDIHLPPGKGSSVDWHAVHKALEEVGYKGVLMVELSDCPPEREPDKLAEMAQALAFLKKV